MKKININDKTLSIEDDIEFLFEKTITKFGTGAKIDASKKFLGKKVYVLVRKAH